MNWQLNDVGNADQFRNAVRRYRAMTSMASNRHKYGLVNKFFNQFTTG